MQFASSRCSGGLAADIRHNVLASRPLQAAVAWRQQAQAASWPASQQRRQLVVQAGGGFGKPAEKNVSKAKLCPCGTGKAYSDCCQPFHAGRLPDTPEQLMRSRYSGYVKGDWRYIVDTTHPLNPLLTDEAAQQGKPTLKDDVIATIEKLGFNKLQVLSTEPGQHDNEGYVTFQAWFKTKNQMGQRAQGWHTQTFVERSRFLREDGKWLYVDGEQDWKR